MLKRLAYLTTGAAPLLLTAAVFRCFNCLNTLTLTQQQTQRRITQWHDQPQPGSDYRELEAAVKNIADRIETLVGQLGDAASTQVGRLYPVTEQLRTLEGQIQAPSASYQHLQQRTAMYGRAETERPVPSPLWAAKTPFSLISNEFRAGRQFAVIIPSGYRSLSQLQLVAPGNSVQGWQLLQLDGGHASFHRGGQQLVLSTGG